MGQITRTNFGLVVTVDILHAAILDIPINPVLLLAAIPGNIIVPQMAVCQTVNIAPYAGIDANSIVSIGPIVPSGGLNVESVLTLGSQAANFTVANLLNSSGGVSIAMPDMTDDHTTALDWNTNISGSNFASAPVKLFAKNALSFTGGDPGNKIRISLFYSVVPVLI